MNMKNLISVNIPIILVFFVSPGKCIRCFVCNSHKNGQQCLIPDLDFRKDCNVYADEHGENHSQMKKNYTLCRKIEMHIEDKYHPEDRIHRACGYMDNDQSADENGCYYKSGYNTKSWICSCKENDCNKVGVIEPGLTLILIGIIAGLLRF